MTECPVCSHKFEAEVNLPEFPLSFQLQNIENDRSIDPKRSYLVTAKQTGYYSIPVEADSEEEAIELANAALDRFASDKFRDEYYCDDEWEFHCDPLQGNMSVHRDYLIKKY